MEWSLYHRTERDLKDYEIEILGVFVGLRVIAWPVNFLFLAEYFQRLLVIVVDFWTIADTYFINVSVAERKIHRPQKYLLHLTCVGKSSCVF